MINNKGWFKKGHASYSKGKNFSDETKLKMSLAKKGKKLSDEHRKKISQSNKGKHKKIVSDETKLKISIALTGRKLSKEHIEKMSVMFSGKNNPNYGNHMSEESKEIIRKSMRGRFVGDKNYFYGIRRFGEENPNWKGGKWIDKWGYTHIQIYGKRIREHRWIVEKVLGRKLKKDEVVHHIDGNKSNNENSNLLVCIKSYHQSMHRRMTSNGKKI